jgi:hypothetical protein
MLRQAHFKWCYSNLFSFLTIFVFENKWISIIKIREIKILSYSGSFICLALFAGVSDSQRGGFKENSLLSQSVKCPLRIAYRVDLRRKRVGGIVEVEQKEENRISSEYNLSHCLLSQNPTRIKLGRKPSLVGEMRATKNLIYCHKKIQTSVTNIPSFLLIFWSVRKITRSDY